GREVRGVAWAARLIFNSGKSYLPASGPTRRKLGGAKPKGARASEAGRLMDRLILSRRSGKNVLKPGLRPSSPHRWRLASRRGQTPGPGLQDLRDRSAQPLPP